MPHTKDMHEGNTKVHPQQYILWIAIASICMMFAGLTSAYIVKRSQTFWKEIDLSSWFYASTVCVVVMSYVMHQALKSYRLKNRSSYSKYLITASLLSILFITFQMLGFYDMAAKGFILSGSVSGSFIYVIVGLHALHVVGGLFALFYLLIRQLVTRSTIYAPTAIEMVAVYWHFVDLLWIYLLLMFFFFS